MEQWKWRDAQSHNALQIAGTKSHIQLGNALLSTLVVVSLELFYIINFPFLFSSLIIYQVTQLLSILSTLFSFFCFFILFLALRRISQLQVIHPKKLNMFVTLLLRLKINVIFNYSGDTLTVNEYLDINPV